jgi:two-component system nitrate/nitrite response regulator NarL
MRVLIVDDQRLFADAMRAVLELSGEMVVGVASDEREALTITQQEIVDVVLLDLNLRGSDGVELGRLLLERYPDIKVVALTASREERSVGKTVRAGFHGYLTKDLSFSRVLAAIDAVMQGHVVMPHHLAPRLAGKRSDEEENASLLAAQLTAREREVLTLLAGGANSKMIAKRLSVTPNTVRTHVQSIHSKLGVHSRLEAVAFALRFGFAKAELGSVQDSPTLTGRKSRPSNPPMRDAATGV